MRPRQAQARPRPTARAAFNLKPSLVLLPLALLALWLLALPAHAGTPDSTPTETPGEAEPTPEATPESEEPAEPAPAAANEPLQVDTTITYEVQPAAEQVHVLVDALATNNNPEHVRRAFGTINFYLGYDLYLPATATNVSAASASGTALETEVTALDDFFDQVAVFFDARFFFGETYSFTLQYDLPPARDANLVISRNYFYFPAFADGTSSNVRIATPAADGFTTTIDNPECGAAEAEGTFQCVVSDPFTFLAYVEVVREGALGTLESTVALQDSDVNLVIEYFEGEDSWAEEISALVARALPVLEQANGHAYAGPETIKIREAARTQTEGYAGRADAACQDECVIQLLPVTSDFVALHEAAHLWSNLYTERWLYEGFADWTAEQARTELAVDATSTTPRLETIDPPEGGLQLINWTELECPPIRCPENRDYDVYGYARSLAFVELLEERVGADALREANALIATSEEPVGAQGFMNAIEEVSGDDLDAEFLEWVFAPEEEETLSQRRDARQQYAELEVAVADSGLVLPESIEQMIEDWEFEQPLVLMPQARAVVPLYRDAEAAVDEDRGILARVGFLGEDPDEHVESSRSAFNAGRFDDAQAEAREALDLVDGAESEGQRRAIIAGVLVATVVLGGILFLWFAGRHKVHRSSYHL